MIYAVKILNSDSNKHFTCFLCKEDLDLLVASLKENCRKVELTPSEVYLVIENKKVFGILDSDLHNKE